MPIWFIAFLWGCISAVSLPIGAVLGLWTKPSAKVTSALMAFGGGALLFALTVELFAKAIQHSEELHDPKIIIAIMVGAVGGGAVFELLNQLLNNQGAFLRKGAVLRKYIAKSKRHEARHMLRSLSRIKLLQALPPEEITRLIPHAKAEAFKPGEVVFSQGKEGDRLYCIVSGEVRVEREEADKRYNIAKLGTGEIFGEMALLFDQPRTATVTTVADTKVLSILKSDFTEMLRGSPRLQQAVQQLASERLTQLQEHLVPRQQDQQWLHEAMNTLERLSIPVTDTDVTSHVIQHQKGNAAFAIWLGIALDGIPESLVIGMLVLTAAAANAPMSLAFIAGVFLANLPEALSSAVTMERQGTKFGKIFWMWMSLCILTGVGAAVGSLCIPVHAEGFIRYFVAGIEGLAAGAMLVMIAETMLPEAFEQGGTVVGLSTLAGFLAALSVKIFG